MQSDGSVDVLPAMEPDHMDTRLKPSFHDISQDKQREDESSVKAP